MKSRPSIPANGIVPTEQPSGINTPSVINPKEVQTNLARPTIPSNDHENDPEESGKDEEETMDEEKQIEEEEDLAEDTIVQHYLTFETKLPSPTSIYPSREGQEPPPPPPDLLPYTSPFEWSDTKKTIIIWMSCFITSLTAFTSGGYSPGIGQMTEEWQVSTTAAYVGITTFCCGFAIAPMVLAPFSEIQGRRPVFIASGILFVLCQLCTGLTQNYPGMLVVRFFVGVGGSTFSTMVGGVVSDIYHTKDRNKPMTIFSGSALFGTGFGPLVSGFIAQNTSWRWIFYMQTLLDALGIALFIIVFKETRGSVLLSRKAKALNKWYEARERAGYYGFDMSTPSSTPSSSSTDEKSPPSSTSQRIRWRVESDEERSSLSKMIAISLYRPFHLLFTEPVVFWFSLWVAFSWAVLYLTIAAIPLVFQRVHGFSLQQSNAVFAAMCVGSVLATALCIYQEKLARMYGKLGKTTPESRIYFACVESAFMPIGLFMFGWTARPDIHWIVPSIAITIATIGIFSIYLSVFNYLADTYHRYASSALAAQSFCRNMLGGIFPLITVQLYDKLSYGPASSLLGGIGTLLTLVPWILVFYGPKIRARSKFASEIMETGGRIT